FFTCEKTTSPNASPSRQTKRPAIRSDRPPIPKNVTESRSGMIRLDSSAHAGAAPTKNADSAARPAKHHRRPTRADEIALERIDPPDSLTDKKPAPGATEGDPFSRPRCRL